MPPNLESSITNSNGESPETNEAATGNAIILRSRDFYVRPCDFDKKWTKNRTPFQ